MTTQKHRQLSEQILHMVNTNNGLNRSNLVLKCMTSVGDFTSDEFSEVFNELELNKQIFTLTYSYLFNNMPARKTIVFMKDTKFMDAEKLIRLSAETLVNLLEK